MGQPEQAPPTEQASGVRVAPVTLVAAAMIGVQFLVRLTIVPQAYWWEDDFFHLAQARTRGLGVDLLVADYNDHLEILGNLLWWVLTRVTDSSWAPAVVLILVLSAGAATTMYVLLRELFGNRPLILVPLAVYLFCPLAVVTYTWLAACLESLPMQIALLGMPWAMMRHRRTRLLRWAILAVVFGVLALLSWEKGVLVLPFTAGLLFLVVDAGMPLRERFDRLASQAWLWGVHLAVLAAFTVTYVRTVDGSERQDVTGADYVQAATTSLFRVFLPGLVGAPWERGDALNTLYPHPGNVLVVVAAAAVLLLITLSVVRNGRTALGPWALAIGYIAVDIGLMLWGRAGFLELVARDPRYVTDAIPVVLVCATAAFVGPIAEGGRRVEPEPGTTRSGHALVPAAVAVGVLGLGCLIMTYQLAPVMNHELSRDYVAAVLVRSDAAPGESIVDTPLPKLVSANVDHRGLLLAMGRHATFNEPSVSMKMFDEDGQLVSVGIDHPILEARGPRPDCGWAVAGGRTVLGTVPSRADGAAPETGLVLRVGNLSGVDGTLTVRVGSDEQSIDLPSGLTSGYFHLKKPRGTISASFDGPDGSGTCVTDLALGVPTPAR